MIFDAGIIIFLGLIFIFMKLPKKFALKLLGRPLVLDIVVSVVAYVLHWGTFTGVMAAAFAGMMCSIFTTIARKLYGYIKNGRYYPGVIKVSINDLT